MSLDSGDTEITLDRSRLNLIKHYRTYYSNSKNEEPLTTYQEESRKQFGEEYERNILMRLLIDNWTGKDFDEQAKITHGMTMVQVDIRNCWMKVGIICSKYQSR